MKYLIKIVTILFLGLFCSLEALFSQTATKLPPVVTEFLYTQSELKDREKEYITASTNLLNAYMEASNFYDGENFSLEKYGKLSSKILSNSCLVPNYLLDEPKMVDLSDYLDYVYTRLKEPNEGLKIDYKIVELLEIRKNPSGNSIATFNMKLELKTYEDKKGLLQTQVQPRIIEMEGIILLEESYLESSKIIELKQTNIESKSGAFNIISGGVSLGFGSLSTMDEFGFRDVNPSASSTGIYLHYLRTLTSSNKIFLWSGLNVSYYSFTTDYTDKYQIQSQPDIFNFEDELTRSFFLEDELRDENVSSLVAVRDVTGGEEEISQSLSISLILGGQYVYDVSTGFDVFFGLGIMPSLLLSNNNGSRSTNFQGLNLPRDPRGTLAIDPNFPSLEELENAGVLDSYIVSGEREETRVVTSQNQFSLNVIGQVNLHYRLNKSWGVSGGLSGIYGLSNFVHYSGDSEALLLGRSDESISILEDYASNSKLFNIGLNLGVYFQFGTVVR